MNNFIKFIDDNKNLAFCYLEHVCREENQGDSEQANTLYEVIVSDAKFMEIYRVFVDLETLRTTIDKFKSRLIFNFGIEGDFLKCNDIPKIGINAVMENVKGSILPLSNNKEKTFVNFIREAILNDWFYVPRDYTEDSKIPLISFSKIHISRQTMSVYFGVTADNYLHNEVLAKIDKPKNKTVEMVDSFQFASREQIEGYNLVSKIHYNNEELFLYCCDTSQLSLKANWLSCSYNLLNKANTMANRYYNYCSVLERYRDLIYKALNPETQNSVEWNGSGNSFQSVIGVYFDTSMNRINKRERDQIVDFVLNTLITTCNNVDEVKAAINEKYKTYEFRVTTYTLFHAIAQADNPNIGIIKATDALEHYRKMKIFSELYLYDIRIQSFLDRIMVAESSSGCIYGSEEPYFTIVKEVLPFEFE